METFYTGFAQSLARLRHRAKLTQQELADRVGCKRLHIIRLEHGTVEPRWPLVLTLARILHTTPDGFVVPEPLRQKPKPGKHA